MTNSERLRELRERKFKQTATPAVSPSANQTQPRSGGLPAFANLSAKQSEDADTNSLQRWAAAKAKKRKKR